MKVLQINSSDVIGRRFNNFDIRHLLEAEGIESRHLVWNRLSDSPSSGLFFDVPGSRRATSLAGRLEASLSIHSRLQYQSFSLPLHQAFRDADLVHYHILHDGYFGLGALPWLSRLKPSVWTWHDPWPMTGHCIYPMSCRRWQIGCGKCPMLDLPFAMRQDKTAEAFRWKQKLIGRMDVNLIVASKHMRKMVELSPIGQNKPTHVIPFGIDLNRFSPRDPSASRARLGILPGRIVIGARVFPESPFKGFEFFVEALRRLGADVPPLAVVTTHGIGHLNEFIGRHQIIDLGWTNDEDLILDTYLAADFFVMPSTAEAFGMMAIEAMACGKPIIVFDGTSLPEITRAPDVGLAVPAANVDALAAAMRELAGSETQRHARGAAGRVVAEAHFDNRLFARRLGSLYQSIASGNKSTLDEDAASY
jgi:glycosyltransferase involved in cell wall biosynthesis